MSNENKTETKTKADAPKMDASNAASHNPFAAFDPMAIWQAFQAQMSAWTTTQPSFTNPVAAWTSSQQAFQKMMTDSVNRAQVWGDEYAAIEQQMLAKANAAIDTWAQLAHDTLSYTAQLSNQARKMSADQFRDAARKAGVGA